MPIEKPETLRVRSCRCYAFGCMVTNPGRVSDGSRMALTIPNSLYRVPLFLFFFWHVLCVIGSFLFIVFVLFLFLVFMLSLELCRCSSDLFLSSRPRTGLATTYITVYASGPIGTCEEHNNFGIEEYPSRSSRGPLLLTILTRSI